MKIAYIIDEIEASGGTERITVVKANALARIPGNEVFIVAAYNRDTSINNLHGVKLVDLDVRYYEDIGLGIIKEFFFLIKKRKEHSRKLKTALEAIGPDIIVSTGMSEKFFARKWSISSNPVLLREIHFTKYYRRMIAATFIEKTIARIGEFWDYNFGINQYDRIVVLTKEDLVTNWKGNPKVLAMPNPLAHPSKETSTYSNYTIISAGRLERQKNHASLISAWRYVAADHPEWKLKIFGKGRLKQSLQNLINEYGLDQQISLEEYTPDIMHEMAESSVFVLTSVLEGMPLVIIEAMSCGLPVVSYECPTGPKDIITDGVNGFLVPVNDEKVLADRLKQLIENQMLRQKMGINALKCSDEYSVDKITDRWMNLFDNLLVKKRKSVNKR